MIRSRHIRTLACLIAAIVLLGAGCAYFNMFYNAQAAYREGMRLKEQNQNSQAKAKFDKAIEKSALVIKRWPKSRWVDDALFLIGASYYQEGQYAKAVREFDQLSLAFPNSGFVPRSELFRGLALLADKQYGTARVTLDAVKQKYPRLADEATYNLARSFIDRKELERGTDSLAAFIERFPKSRFRTEAVKLLADGSFTLRRYADAEKWYESYARQSDDPKQRALATLKTAASRYEQGKYDEAADEVTDVLGRYPELDDEANLLLGKVLSTTGRPNEALAAWAKVKGTSDLGAEAAFRIGKHYEEGADFDRARASYDTARMRRIDSDYGVLAVKRLALLDALAARMTGKKAGGDSLTPAEAMFLVAEVTNLNLGDYDKATDLYQKVYDSFPDTDWAAKALFAKAWILRNVKNDTVGAEPLLRQEIARYPETEYADESRRWLGLPVPKREKKKPEVEPETTATVPPAMARESARTPGVEPVPPELLPGDTNEMTARREPGMIPRGHREPGRLPGQQEEVKGTTGRGESLQAKPDTVAQRPGVGAQGLRDTVPLPTSPSPSSDTVKPAKPPETPEPVKPAAKLQLDIAHFATDSWQIQASDSTRLKADAESIKAHPDVKVVIVGHCDPRASETYNRELGRRRAQAVRDFLVAQGIDAERLSVRSDGEKRPISTKPDEYWLDRRVEFEFR